MKGIFFIIKEYSSIWIEFSSIWHIMTYEINNDAKNICVINNYFKLIKINHI